MKIKSSLDSGSSVFLVVFLGFILDLATSKDPDQASVTFVLFQSSLRKIQIFHIETLGIFELTL